MRLQPPVLANYASLDGYRPQHGDFVVWSGWFNVWFGLVMRLDKDDKVAILFESGSPYLLFNMTDDEQDSNTVLIPLSKIKNSRRGEWAIQRHEQNNNCNVWYV